jgi:hypothetical protein
MDLGGVLARERHEDDDIEMNCGGKLPKCKRFMSLLSESIKIDPVSTLDRNPSEF